MACAWHRQVRRADARRDKHTPRCQRVKIIRLDEKFLINDSTNIQSEKHITKFLCRLDYDRNLLEKENEIT